MKAMKFLVLGFALVVIASSFVCAGVSTQTTTGTCPDGVTTWSVKTTYDNVDGKVLSTENTNCGGVTKTTTYTYLLVVNANLQSTAGSFSVASTNFTISIASQVDIINVNTLATAHSYSGTIAAATSTAIPSGIGSGVFILVARDPNNLSTVFASKIYIQ